MASEPKEGVAFETGSLLPVVSKTVFGNAQDANKNTVRVVYAGLSWESPGIDPLDAIDDMIKNQEEARKHWLPNSKP